jgi:hypothetical protein
MTTLTVNRRDAGGQAVERPAVEVIETPAHRSVSTCAAAVRMTIEDDGSVAVARIDVAVECGFVVDQVKTETMSVRAAFFTVIPA